jgi:hypothetical protein
MKQDPSNQKARHAVARKKEEIGTQNLILMPSNCDVNNLVKYVLLVVRNLRKVRFTTAAAWFTTRLRS